MGRTQRRKGQQRPQARWRRRLVPLAVLAAVAVAFVAWWVTDAQRNAPKGGVALAALRPPDIHALSVLPDDERALVFGSHAGLAISRDAGATWSKVAGANVDAMSIAMPSGSRTAIIAGHDVYLRSDDGGASWRPGRSGLPGTDVHGFAASVRDPNTFYAYVVGAGLLRSADVGASWTAIPGAPPSTHSLTVARSSAGDVIFAVAAEGLRRSADAGRTWQAVPDVAAASVSAAGDIVYAASGANIFVSGDAGASWQRRAFPPRRAVLIAPAPSRPETIYVVTDRFEVHRSRDGGSTWERVG